LSLTPFPSAVSGIGVGFCYAHVLIDHLAV
jgi:hypothetical protein